MFSFKVKLLIPLTCFEWPILDKLLDFYPLVISYELLEGEVFNSKFCINPLEPISMAIER